MNILLTGATGFIGSHLLRALLAQGHQVTACVRDPERAARQFPGPRYIACDFTRDHGVESWRDRLAGIEVVINAVGIIRESGAQTFHALHFAAPRALFLAAAAVGVKQVIQISALGADGEAHSQYHLTKRAADDVLAGLDLDGLILRPSIVHGAGARSSEMFRALAALPVIPVPGDGRQPLQPIHIDDLVRVVLADIAKPEGGCPRIDLVGPEPVTFADILLQMRHWLGLARPRLLHVPYALLLPIARIGGFLGDAPMTPETVAMLRRGNCAPVQPLIDRFDVTPTGLAQVLGRTPATQADRWHAQLYWLRPLLRLGIAFVWISAAIVSALLYPAADSYALLAQTGIQGIFAPLALYGAAALDLALGIAVLTRYRLRETVWLQTAVIIGYTLIISWALPEYWLHPFGPLTKNVPLLAAIFIMYAMERR
jgi:uncharacterized protein YbjT (DUF2867 family)